MGLVRRPERWIVQVERQLDLIQAGLQLDGLGVSSHIRGAILENNFYRAGAGFGALHHYARESAAGAVVLSQRVGEAHIFNERRGACLYPNIADDAPIAFPTGI